MAQTHHLHLRTRKCQKPVETLCRVLSLIMENNQGGYSRAPDYAAQPYGGLQAQGANQASSLTSKEKVPLFIYFISAGLAVVMGIVVISLHSWVRYCDSHISLTEIRFRDYEHTVSHLLDHHSEAPDHGLCGDYYLNLKRFQDAGVVVMWLGSLSTVFTVIRYGHCSAHILLQSVCGDSGENTTAFSNGDVGNWNSGIHCVLCRSEEECLK